MVRLNNTFFRFSDYWQGNYDPCTLIVSRINVYIPRQTIDDELG